MILFSLEWRFISEFSSGYYLVCLSNIFTLELIFSLSLVLNWCIPYHSFTHKVVALGKQLKGSLPAWLLLVACFVVIKYYGL